MLAEEPVKSTRGPKLTLNQESMITVLEQAGTGGLSVEEWNEQAREAGISRKQTLYNCRIALKDKKLVYEWDER